MSLPNEHRSHAHNGDLVLAVDIGGTKIALAVVTSTGEILADKIFPTPQAGPENGIALIIKHLETLIRDSAIDANRLVGIGIGIPAVLEPGNDFIVWGPNLIGWKKVNLRGELEKHFGLPVSVEYDGHTAVLGEWWMGAGKGYQSVVSVIIGTGVGGGMVLDGHLIRGQNRLAGAVGWFSFEQNDPEAEIEGRSVGNWEALIAGPGISRRVKKLLADTPPTEKEKSKLQPEST
ncbi:ROK family protein, partial [bacterium]|nr:ROK family protein [bacterium]